MLKKAFVETANKLKLELQKTDYVAVTFDAWTSLATESYLTVTCHYIDYAWCLKSALLSTKPLNEISHTAENLSKALNEIFIEWQNDNKIVCIVTDNAANMIKTCSILQKRHMPCFAHLINLVVQDSLPCVENILKKFKSTVTYFKSSYVAMETFKKEQNTNEGSAPLKLLQEVPTRWNSSFYMIQRINQTSEALNRALLQLKKAPAPLSLEGCCILKEIEKVLLCFEELKTEEGKTFCTNLIDAVKTSLFPYEIRTVNNFYAQALLNHARVTAAEVQYSGEYDEEHFETKAETEAETIADKNASNLVKTEVTTVATLQKTVSSAASSADKELRSPWTGSDILKLIILYGENQESFKSTVIRKRSVLEYD
ncbi:unnamed protein product [Psylliodes chrysocephalus]|uniref:Uncharacterized protein n=1 Tax=Psylliodes chrysocephalus TaxID=3402493 RepID=A0A9P0D6P3_9CUCU|nr:unnamed protein product [Psylliodes chrysocephala]